jgi:hypothetical protein
MELEINYLRVGVMVCREMLGGRECLVEVHYGLPVRSFGNRLFPGLAAIDRSFVPYLSSEGVIGHVLDTVGTELSESFNHLRMEDTTLLLWQSFIDHLLGEREDEGIDQFGQKVCLSEPPGRLQVCKAT